MIHGLRPPDSGKCGETKPLSQSDSQQLSPRDKDSLGSAACLIPAARPGIPCSSNSTGSRSGFENQPGPETQDGVQLRVPGTGYRHQWANPRQGVVYPVILARPPSLGSFGNPPCPIPTKALSPFSGTFSASSKGRPLFHPPLSPASLVLVLAALALRSNFLDSSCSLCRARSRLSVVLCPQHKALDLSGTG